MVRESSDSSSSAVAERLDQVQEAILASCDRAGRAHDEVTLIAVSKRIALADVATVCAAGQWNLGENRIQEALPRQDELAGLLTRRGLPADRLRWHFIGHLQSNKAGKAVGRFALLHGVDSVKLAAKISQRAANLGSRQRILVEINVAGEAQKHGLACEESVEAVARIAELPGLEVAGLMGMARHGAPTVELHATFARLRGLAEKARENTGLPLPELSMGMSADFEVAIAEGATLVRVGSAIFGSRAPR